MPFSADDAPGSSTKPTLFIQHLAAVLMLLLLSMLSIHLFGDMVLRVPVFTALIFVSAITTPKLAPAWAVFLCGMVIDFTADGPLGVYALLFVIAQNVLARRRPILLNGTFTASWVTFWVMSVIITVVPWLISSLLHGKIFSPAPALLGAGINGLIYPILSRPLFVLAQRLDADKETLD